MLHFAAACGRAHVRTQPRMRLRDIILSTRVIGARAVSSPSPAADVHRALPKVSAHGGNRVTRARARKIITNPLNPGVYYDDDKKKKSTSYDFGGGINVEHM